MDASPSRREALRAAGAVGGAAGVAALLAACTPDGTGPGGDVESSAPGTELVATGDVPVGSGVSAMDGRNPVLVAQPTAGAFVAFSAVCPHQGCAVRPDDAEFACPCHGSRFALDGSLVQGPATKGLTPIAVQVDGDRVVTA